MDDTIRSCSNIHGFVISSGNLFRPFLFINIFVAYRCLLDFLFPQDSLLPSIPIQVRYTFHIATTISRT
jgi:hypothetical protein